MPPVDEPRPARPPAAPPYGQRDQPVPSQHHRYGLMAAVVVAVAFANAIAVSAQPFAAIRVLFWLDVLIAFSVPLAAWAARPDSVHRAACVLFAVVVLGVAVLSLIYVAAAGASY